MLKQIVGLSLILLSSSLWALVPIEGALLGKVNEDFQKDPLDLIFKKDETDQSFEQKQAVRLFNGFILEGERLENSCRQSPKLYYSESWRERTATISVASTLQYIGLDLTTRAIGKYAKILDFTPEEYQNLTDRLIKNYCSPNLTVISLRSLKENLAKRFGDDNNFVLPEISSNLHYPRDMAKYAESLKARENEFLTTVKLFRSFCSWDGEPQDFRLMIPLLKNPFIMAFINRLIVGEKLAWDSQTNQLKKTKIDSSHLKTLCRDLVCRPTEEKEFNRDFPRSIGSPELESDLNRIYCQKLRDLDYKMREQEEHVKKWINDQSLEEEKFAQMQMIALITGVPNFLMSANTYKDFVDIAKLGVVETWTNWAQKSNQEFTHELYYEESLRIQVVDRSFYYFFMRPDFQVKFDLSLGEFDRTTVLNDKVGFLFDLKLNKDYVRWVRGEYLNATTAEASDIVLKNFITHISPQMEKLKGSLKITPWNEGLERLVAVELLEQFRLYQGNFFSKLGGDEVSIPLDFRYGVFALKYMNYRAKTKPSYEKNQAQKDRPQS